MTNKSEMKNNYSYKKNTFYTEEIDKKSTHLRGFFLIVLSLIVGTSFGQTTLFQFNFENTIIPNIDNVVGIPDFSFNGINNTGYTTNTPCQAARMYTGANWDTGNYYRFTVNTTGFSNLTFSFCNRADNVSIGTFLVRVSSNGGGSWTTVLATYTPTTANNTLTTITFPATANNAGAVWIEISKVSNGANNARELLIDSATLTGTPALPTITTFSPNNACANSGTSVVISGTNFTVATSVSFNGTAAAFVINNSNQITATLPNGANTGTISVTNGGGTATSVGTFTVKPLPTVNAITGTATICASSTTTLSNSTAGGIWSSASTGVATINSSGVVSAAGTGTSVISYTVTGGNGCTNVATRTVTVSAAINPIIEFTQGLGDTVFNLNSPCGIVGLIENDLDIVSGNPGGSATLQWQVSYNNGVTWSNGPGPTSTTTQYFLDPLYTIYESVSGVYKFRLIITNNGCAGTSNVITLNVAANSNLTSGVISGNQSFCAASANPNSFTQTTAPTGGNGTYTYQWQSSLDNSTFNDIAGATGNTYDSPVISQTTYFRRIVYSGGCYAISNTLTVIIGIPTITLTANSVTCFSNSAQNIPLTYIGATGSPVKYSITWNPIPTNSFAAITDAALIGSPITISVPANTPIGSYSGTLTVKNVGGCSSVNNAFTIIVNGVTSTGTIATNQTICSGGDPLAFSNIAHATLPGVRTYQWQSSISGCGSGWSDIPAATGATYDPPSGILVTTFYRRVAISTILGVSCSDFSNCTSVTVNAINPGIIGNDQSFCSATLVAFTFTTAPTASGTLSYQWQTNTTGCGGTWSNISGATGSTYLPAAVSQNTYYRVNVTSNLGGVLCNNVSNCVAITAYSKTWNGNTNADWALASNWTPNGVPTAIDCIDIPNVTNGPIISGIGYTAYGNNLNIQNGAILQVNTNNNITLTNQINVDNGGQFLIKNSASLIQINNVTNNGAVNIERITQPMYRFDYTYWGSPVTLASNFTLGMLSPLTLSDKYFSWIPTVANSFGNWFYESSATIMDPIKGYIVRAPQTFSFTNNIKVSYTANFIGTPNNGDVYCPIYFGGLPLANNNDKYNLLGNPYASAVDAELFLSNTTNKTIIDGTIYFWTHNSPPSAANVDPFYGDFIINYAANDYASWNRLGGTGTTAAAGSGGNVPSGFIASGQGFFAKSTGTATSGDPVVFKNTMRVNFDNNMFFRNAIVDTETKSADVNLIEKHRLWLNLVNNGGSFNQILVGYATDATNEYDRDFDGVRFTDNNSITIYSIIQEKKLVIQGRALPFNDTDLVPLGYKSTLNDTFSIRIDHFDGLFEYQNIYIEDRLLNVIHDLKQSPYSFTSTIGTFDDRFVLRYTNTLLNTTNPEFTNSLISFIENEKLIIRSSEKIKEVTVFDISGRLIQSTLLEQPVKNFNANFSNSAGVFLLRIKWIDGSIINKKVIQN